MSNKFYNQKSFAAELSNGDTLYLHCSTQKTRYGFRHVCDFRRPGEYSYTRAKCCYYNRTWESFRYESVLKEAARKMQPEHAAAVRAMIEQESAKERAAAEKMLNDFKTAWNNAPAEIKQVIADGPAIQSPEHAALATGILQAAALLKTVK
jgi:hypothetical protein